MKLKPFLVVYMPFPDSDLTSERTEYGVDEEDAVKQFRAKYSAWRVKEVREQ